MKSRAHAELSGQLPQLMYLRPHPPVARPATTAFAKVGGGSNRVSVYAMIATVMYVAGFGRCCEVSWEHCRYCRRSAQRSGR